MLPHSVRVAQRIKGFPLIEVPHLDDLASKLGAPWYQVDLMRKHGADMRGLWGEVSPKSLVQRIGRPKSQTIDQAE